MTATPKPKAQLSIVPDLSSLESTLTEFAQQQAPMLSRAAVRRQKSEQELDALAAELKTVEEREAMVERFYQTLKTAFGTERADIEQAMRLITHGTTEPTAA